MAMERAVSRNPEDGEAHRNVGVILLGMGRLAEAEVHLRTAIARNRGYSDAYDSLGDLLCRLGRMEEAERCFREVVRIDPEKAEAHYKLGAFLLRTDSFSEADFQFREAVRLDPAKSEAHFNIGIFALRRGFLGEAELRFREAIRLTPDFSEAVLNLGNVCNERQQFLEAEKYYREAIRLHPEGADAYFNLGLLMADLGDLTEATGYLQRAMERKPDQAEFVRKYVKLAVVGPHDPVVARVERLYNDAAISEEGRMHICFAMGKIYDDLGEHDKAFGGFAEGNRLRKKRLGYSIHRDRAAFHKIRQTFAVMPPVDHVPSAGIRPILIVGMPRSGTSLVEQILSSHSHVHGAGELETLNGIVQHHFQDAPEGQMPDVCRVVTESYFEELGKLAKGKPFITDKMPHNFRLLGFILSANPEIMVVHTIRDRMAVCWSIYKQYFPATGVGYAYDMEDLAEYYKLYQELMAFWHERFPGRIYDLDYEKLTECQEEETRKLLEYCGLPWEDDCLSFYETRRAVKTASAAQVRQKMYRGSSEAWRPYEPYLGPLVQGLGRSAGEASSRTDKSNAKEGAPVSQDNQLTKDKTPMTTITIDNKEYKLDELSQEAKAQLASLQFVDNELTRLQAQMAALQTARMAYARALQESLPKLTT